MAARSERLAAEDAYTLERERDRATLNYCLKALANRPTHKTSHLSSYVAYLSYVRQHGLKRLFSFTPLTKRVRKARFRGERAKRRWMDELVYRFRDGLVAIGSSYRSANSAIHTSCGPIQEIKDHMIRNWTDLVEFDEYHTSKTCSDCEILWLVKYPPRDPDDPTTQRKPWSINYCPTCSKGQQGTDMPVIRHRDTNASRNIFKCAVAQVYGRERPSHLCRTDTPAPPPNPPASPSPRKALKRASSGNSATRSKRSTVSRADSVASSGQKH